MKTTKKKKTRTKERIEIEMSSVEVKSRLRKHLFVSIHSMMPSKSNYKPGGNNSLKPTTRVIQSVPTIAERRTKSGPLSSESKYIDMCSN